jgi:hypothetical protein
MAPPSSPLHLTRSTRNSGSSRWSRIPIVASSSYSSGLELRSADPRPMIKRAVHRCVCFAAASGCGVGAGGLGTGFTGSDNGPVVDGPAGISAAAIRRIKVASGHAAATASLGEDGGAVWLDETHPGLGNRSPRVTAVLSVEGFESAMGLLQGPRGLAHRIATAGLSWPLAVGHSRPATLIRRTRCGCAPIWSGESQRQSAPRLLIKFDDN